MEKGSFNSLLTKLGERKLLFSVLLFFSAFLLIPTTMRDAVEIELLSITTSVLSEIKRAAAGNGCGYLITQDALPLTITKSGKYSVAQDLANAGNITGTAIIVAANNVCIDFNCRTLDWTGGSAGIEVQSGLEDVSIQNGSIQNASLYGIAFDHDCNGIKVDHIVGKNCGSAGLFIQDGCNNIVIKNSEFTNNGAASVAPAMVTDAGLIQTFSTLEYSTLATGYLNDHGWYALKQMEQTISAGAYIRGTLGNRCYQITIDDCMFNNNRGPQNVGGLVITFADNIDLANSSCNSNIVTQAGGVSRGTGALLAAVNNVDVENCLFAENMPAGDGLPSGVCLQGFGINDEQYKVRCASIRFIDCVARNNARSVFGAPALNIHGGNFDMHWADNVALIDCQSSHAERGYQVVECANVSYENCEAVANAGNDVPSVVNNGFIGFWGHQAGNIIHENCRVLGLDQTNLHPASTQGARGFAYAPQDTIDIAEAERHGENMTASPFDSFMTATPMSGLIFKNCIVNQAFNRGPQANAVGIQLVGVSASLVSHCVINGVQQFKADQVISGSGIELLDALKSTKGAALSGPPFYNQSNWIVDNEVFGCYIGLADLTLASSTTARCAYLGNKLFHNQMPYSFSEGLEAATPILTWALSTGSQPGTKDAAGNPPTQWTNLVIK